ncbi:MAG: formimidoylglutamate deiminase, partial [Nocardioides sp.]
MTGYSLQRAWVDGTVLDDVLVEVAGGRFTRVTPDVAAADVPRATRLDGLTLPGLA